AVPGTRGDWTGYGAEGAETATLFPADGTGRMLRLDIVPDSEGWRCICREDLKPPGWNDPAARRGHCAHRWEARVDAEAAAAAWVAP
ncbi:hypothetical protein, partial [Roseomonas sp. TAS13]|uniref:hypothetical protein n=1 Tax=Roseomonas sp. TAS13 TaxID=1926319 RepID=UPI001C0B9E56